MLIGLVNVKDAAQPTPKQVSLIFFVQIAKKKAQDLGK